MKLVRSLVLGYATVTYHLVKQQSPPPLATQYTTICKGKSLKLVKNITLDSLLSMEYKYQLCKEKAIVKLVISKASM
jgi:propanediol dehydratase small subunit